MPIKIEENSIREISEYSKRKEKLKSISKIQIKFGNKIKKFEIDKILKRNVSLEGLDDIALSLENIKKIENFEKIFSVKNPGYNCGEQKKRKLLLLQAMGLDQR